MKIDADALLKSLLNPPKPKVGEIQRIPPPDSFEAAHPEEWTVRRFGKDRKWHTLYGKERLAAEAEYYNQEKKAQADWEKEVFGSPIVDKLRKRRKK